MEAEQQIYELHQLFKVIILLQLNLFVPPPWHQTVAWPGWQQLAWRERAQTVWLSPPSSSRYADCQEKVPPWLLSERKARKRKPD